MNRRGIRANVNRIEVPQISSSEVFKELRTALWHLRAGGTKQLREWQKKQLGTEELSQVVQTLELEQAALKAERIAMKRELKALRNSLRTREKTSDRLEAKLEKQEAVSFATSLLSGHALTSSASSPEVAYAQYRNLAKHGLHIPAIALANQHALLGQMTNREIRNLIKRCQKAGYWRLQLEAERELASRTSNNRDELEYQKTRSKIAVFERPVPVLADRVSSAKHPRGPVLHVVGNSPFTIQSGYTMRTAYLVRSQIDQGIPAIVAVQPGVRGSTSEKLTRRVADGVEYLSLPGLSRAELGLTDWFEQFVLALETVVELERPSVLHAHSDFLNGAAAIRVGRKHGIPVIYESRGFWEESWLSRFGHKYRLGLRPAEALENVGLPEAYSLRKRAEESVRSNADAIITLASVMESHIRRSLPKGPPIYVVPNAVDSEVFHPIPKDQPLMRSVGIDVNTVVLGYVTSMVEYEGVDVLVKAFSHLLKTQSRPRLHLMLVGDGPVLGQLKSLAESLGVSEAVTFSGKVPHDQVNSYYSLIDVFVVPRRPTRVSHLVTPLKPYEAMAMGKPVVMSGVDALKEITEQSEAALTFVPNDPRDLARVLEPLISDSSYRQELAEKARRWVTESRSWQHNAQATRKIYQSLDADWNSFAYASGGNRNATIRDHLKDNPPPLSGWFVLGTSRDDARTVMEHGWQYRDYPRIKLDSKTEWEKYPQVDRSLASWLQSWYFLDSFYKNSRLPTEPETVFMLNVVSSWNDTRSKIARSSTPDDSMMYYDMALALRAPRLLRLIWTVLQFEALQDEADWLIDLLIHERRMLREESAFTSRTNHGFYTAAAQLHLEKFLPPMADHHHVYRQARERMNLLVASQFAEDGGHLEHSPAYHRLLLGSFDDAVQEGLIDDEQTLQRLQRAADIIGWMVQPDGNLVNFGDSEPQKLAVSANTQSPGSQWVISDGQAGRPVQEELLHLPDSGYVFVRSPQPIEPGERSKSSYLAFQGGFHSRAHKHADDLSLVWFDRGSEVLIDAGKWAYGDLLPVDSPLREQGFYYAAPERQYIESVEAHNTVEVDGKGQDRRRTPYGSAILSAAEENNGRFTISAKASHTSYEHCREIAFTPRSSLNIKDSLMASDEIEHQASVWFLINGKFDLVSWEAKTLSMRLPDGQVLEISSSGVIQEPIRGQKNPLLGWRSVRSRELEPAWSIQITTPFMKNGSIETLFEFVEG